MYYNYCLFVGSHLYVSAEGEFEIYEGSKFQRRFGPGIAFGELALLYNTKRLRSIKGEQKNITVKKCDQNLKIIKQKF